MNKLDKTQIRSLLPKRAKDAHKGSCGEVMIISGSYGMTGAAVLCSRGALRVGAGLVKLAVPKSLQKLIDAQTPEVITYGLDETDDHFIAPEAITQVEKLSSNSSVIACGPGLQKSTISSGLVMINLPVVLDADGLNSVAGDASTLKNFKNLIITPHPGEFSKLTGIDIKDIQKNREKLAKKYAKEWGCIVVLKGAQTVVADPSGKASINPTGNPGMASGGVGDVLTGMIAGLIAQGASLFDSAVAGVFIHGLAADLAAESKGVHGLIASDVVDMIPEAILKCLNN